MLGKIVLIFEIAIIILFGIFVRTDESSTSSMTSISSSLLFVAVYAYIMSRQRSLDWTVLTNYLFIAALAFQINTLYYFFWYQVFADTFSSTSSMTSGALITGVQASLAVVVTTSFFMNRLTHLQIFIICMLEVFAFSTSWGICRWGVQAITSGGASTVWLFGIIFAILIKKLKFQEVSEGKASRYFTKLLQVVGLMVLVCLWPAFNETTTSLDLTVTNLASTALLQQQSYVQTWLCLFSCIATTLSLRIIGEKMIIQKIMNSIINTGILISSSACLIIDPFASLLLGMIGPIICFIYDKFAEKIISTGYPFDMLIISFLGGVFSSIFAGGRNGRTPQLSSDPIRQGGLQFSMTLICILFAGAFGAIAGIILRFTGSETLQHSDLSIWEIEPDALPLYHDDPKLEKLYRIEDRQRLQTQQAHFSLKQRYLSSQIKQAREGVEQGKVIKQEVNYTSRISNSDDRA